MPISEAFNGALMLGESHRDDGMRHFPIFIDLEDQPVLVVGGGVVAERKIRLLLRAGARVRVVAASLGPGVGALHRRGEVDWRARHYAAEQLAGIRLAYGATDDARLNHRVYRDAEAAGVLVNVVDDTAHCRFISPAVVDRSPLLVAISSGGGAPVLARRVRGWLERALPEGMGRIAAVAARLRPRLKAALDVDERRRFWDGLLTRRRVLDWSSQSAEAIEREVLAALERRRDATLEPGRVFLVGAGPGNPDLLTVRALRVLGQADVVLHDRLVPEAIVDLARRDAQRIDVGKRAGDHHASQAEIHRLMAEHARAGKWVVRLKGGDPFVFGRGGEEQDWLAARGIACEVVPGITAATGCGASAGIPLTHREHARVLSFVTGHEVDGDDTDWGALAGPGRTLVVYMGVRQAAAVRERLLAAGISPTLPTALVANGTREDEAVFRGTVDTLPALAERVPPGAAGLLIVGEVTAQTLAAAQRDPEALAAAA